MPIDMILKHLWSWVKHYWYIPMVVALGAVVYLLTRRTDFVDWRRVLQEADQAHQQEVAAIQGAHDAQAAADAVATKRAQDVEAQVRAEYARNERTLDVQKEKRVLAIIDGLKHDPQGMANEIERETGYRVLVL